MTEDVEKAHKLACLARSKAHAPYSHFKVGAAVKLKGVAEAIPGCNVENASFGATICAERVALTSAASQFGKIQPEFIVVVTSEKKPTVPCALCLQVMAEFCADDLPVYLGNEAGVSERKLFKELLPFPFRKFEATKK